MAVVEDDLRLVPLAGGPEVPRLEIRDVHRVVHGAALPGLEDVAVVHFGEILIVDELVFGAGDVRNREGKALHHVVEHTAVAALGDLPIPLEVEILENLLRDDVPVLVAADAGGLDGPVLHGPGVAAERLAVEVPPAVQGVSVEEELPSIGLLGLREGIVLGRAARQDGRRDGGDQKQSLFHGIEFCGQSLAKVRKMVGIPEKNRNFAKMPVKDGQNPKTDNHETDFYPRHRAGGPVPVRLL